ncbi:hypothetical protein TNCV_2270981 [Trichonephila clavipes]|nr:hypothetical protein TNCV_2270981 [Trichonephila clavipes]
MVLKANDRRTSCPCHDEFHGLRSDYVRQVALATTTGLVFDILLLDLSLTLPEVLRIFSVAPRLELTVRQKHCRPQVHHQDHSVILTTVRQLLKRILSCFYPLSATGVYILAQLPILAVSGQSLASNGTVVDSRYLNLVSGQAEAPLNKGFLSSPTKYTVEPSWPLVLVMGDATTTNMTVNFDYFCDFIDIFDDGPVCGRIIRMVTNPPKMVDNRIIKNDTILALSPRFCQVSIESSL